MNLKYLLPVILSLACLLAVPASAQQSKRYGPYELHYSVVSTTFLSPEVAARYGIVRGEKKAILNLALREHLPDGTERASKMTLSGRSWDLMQRNETLDFKEIDEGQAIYYIAPLNFIEREWRSFEVEFTPADSEQSYTFEHKHQLYSD